MTVSAAIGSALRSVQWYVTNLMGDHAYATYVEHHERTHPGEPVMSEREFWKKRYADQAAEPRCC
ncbi:YbdD/YjiX family protein [Microbacterium sp. NC79]|uniref:YbdD/YjiX family protein n=1 Tax=Microbacterium sp. NC79 TaxID=2851009 RepID=UPI001C2BE0DE|nr:YbdD/YjiX family protein [Microbacterium sp. NC79]MBV0893791.1 YbdD/YjiX family protein [Microbacterium sp. NC79]